MRSETQRFRCGHKARVPVGCDEPEPSQNLDCDSKRQRNVTGVLMRPDMCPQCTPLSTKTDQQTESQIPQSHEALPSPQRSAVTSWHSEVSSSVDSNEPSDVSANIMSRRTYDQVITWIEDQSIRNPPNVGSMQEPEIVPLATHKIARKPVLPSYADRKSSSGRSSASTSSSCYSYRASRTARAQRTAETSERNAGRQGMSTSRDGKQRCRMQVRESSIEARDPITFAQRERPPRRRQTRRWTPNTNETEWPRIPTTPAEFFVTGFDNPRKAPNPPAIQSPRQEIGKPSKGYAEHRRQKGKHRDSHTLPPVSVPKSSTEPKSVGTSPLSFSFIKSLWRSSKSVASPHSEASSAGNPPLSPMRKLSNDFRERMNLRRQDSMTSFACLTALQQTRDGLNEKTRKKGGPDR
jgi:hypothetical protein